jgi:hypothetical protein
MDLPIWPRCFTISILSHRCCIWGFTFRECWNRLNRRRLAGCSASPPPHQHLMDRGDADSTDARHHATFTHRRAFSSRPRVGMCRQCPRPRATNVRHSGRVRATMGLMSVFLFRIKGRSCPNTREHDYTSRAAQVVRRGSNLYIFHRHLFSLEWQARGVIAMCGRAHSPTNDSPNHSWANLGECIRRCVEVASQITTSEPEPSSMCINRISPHVSETSTDSDPEYVISQPF